MGESECIPHVSGSFLLLDAQHVRKLNYSTNVNHIVPRILLQHLTNVVCNTDIFSGCSCGPLGRVSSTWFTVGMGRTGKSWTGWQSQREQWQESWRSGWSPCRSLVVVSRHRSIRYPLIRAGAAKLSVPGSMYPRLGPSSCHRFACVFMYLR